MKASVGERGIHCMKFRAKKHNYSAIFNYTGGHMMAIYDGNI